MMGGGPGLGGGRQDERSCVVVVHNLAMGEVNCDRLFNLVCQYGNVSKIFFMKTKPGCAMIEMCDHEGAQRVISNIQVTASNSSSSLYFILCNFRELFCLETRSSWICPRSISGSQTLLWNSN